MRMGFLYMLLGGFVVTAVHAGTNLDVARELDAENAALMKELIITTNNYGKCEADAVLRLSTQTRQSEAEVSRYSFDECKPELDKVMALADRQMFLMTLRSILMQPGNTKMVQN